jgi:D-alanyl-D-alanine carboxypeptidase
MPPVTSRAGGSEGRGHRRPWRSAVGISAIAVAGVVVGAVAFHARGDARQNGSTATPLPMTPAAPSTVLAVAATATPSAAAASAPPTPVFPTETARQRAPLAVAVTPPATAGSSPATPSVKAPPRPAPRAAKDHRHDEGASLDNGAPLLDP